LKRTVSRNNVYFPSAPHKLDIKRIVRPSAAYELSLSANSRWLYVEVQFMDQSKSAPPGEAARNTTTAPSKNIVDTVGCGSHFTTFAAAINAAGLTGDLAAKGPFTVFAPTDEAFKKLPAGAYDNLLKDAGKLKAILNYHVVSGHLMARDLKSGEVATAQGTPLTASVSSSDVRVNGARVTQADTVATNGIVHAIDAVILPKNWQLAAAA
jgi:uncharacterized surface protein with fasciclin (FAS1) repeats